MIPGLVLVIIQGIPISQFWGDSLTKPPYKGITNRRAKATKEADPFDPFVIWFIYEEHVVHLVGGFNKQTKWKKTHKMFVRLTSFP